MKILVAGATGFVGRHLVPRLLQDRHEVLVLGRSTDKLRACFGSAVSVATWEQLAQLDPGEFQAVINLAGENIAQGRWTPARKAQIYQSRLDATTRLVEFCSRATGAKPHLYNTSAIGYYGIQASQPKTEADMAAKPSDFLAEVAQAWEQAAQRAASHGVAVTLMRFGVVLKAGEGMLKPLLPGFRLGLGTVLGDGQQYLSWILIEDLIAAIVFLLQHPAMLGAVNVCAPEAVTQAAFARMLAQAVKRPLWLTLPAWFVRIAFGQMGDELLLGSTRVYPQRLLESGFRFAYPTLPQALAHTLA